LKAVGQLNRRREGTLSFVGWIILGLISEASEGPAVSLLSA
jgi:hypothetical protein